MSVKGEIGAAIETLGLELISKDLAWLLCENHRDTLIALGAAVQERMPRGDC